MPPILGTRNVVWRNEAQCEGFAQHMARAPAITTALIELHGPLGAGKTTWVRALLKALGVQGRIKSPSYAVVEPHETPSGSVQHFDFYRFNDPSEWEDAGFRDLFAAPGLKLVEWPQKAGDLLPAADAELHLTPPAVALDAPAAEASATGEPRQVRVVALSPLGQALVASWQTTEQAHG